jgi:hypothetical protein
MTEITDSAISLAPLYAAYDTALAAAKKHAPMGYIDKSGMAALYRCAAREFGCTPSEVLLRRQLQTTEAAPGLAAALRGSY